MMNNPETTYGDSVKRIPIRIGKSEKRNHLYEYAESGANGKANGKLLAEKNAEIRHQFDVCISHSYALDSHGRVHELTHRSHEIVDGKIQWNGHKFAEKTGPVSASTVVGNTPGQINKLLRRGERIGLSMAPQEPYVDIETAQWMFKGPASGPSPEDAI